MRQFIKKNIWAVAPVVFVLVALVLLGSPFGSGNVQETPAEDDNLIVVGVSQVGSESVWRTAQGTGEFPYALCPPILLTCSLEARYC